MTTEPNAQPTGEQPADQQPQTIDPSRVLTDERGHIVVKDGRVQLKPEPQRTAMRAAGRPATEEPGEPEPTEQSQATEQEPAAGYRLETPSDVPTAAAIKWDSTLDGFSKAASGAGIPQPIAQNLMQSFIDADAALGGYGNGENAYTSEDAESSLRAFWGREAYDGQMRKVWKTVKGLGTHFAEWLDGSGMGDHPAVCVALANWADTKLTKAQAQAELSKIMSDEKSDYFSQDSWRRQPAVVRVKMLGRLAYAEDAPVSHPVARARNAEAARVEQAATKARADARSEAAALVAKLDKGTPAEREATKKRFIELTARL
ncbi:MAG: hypothetical protein DMD46_17135 [Gemmatimonadetes bacterium]|nr:MAG: hypothetical protein DMD46_17135 [Gemmatimonadota bacterium]